MIERFPENMQRRLREHYSIQRVLLSGIVDVLFTENPAVPTAGISEESKKFSLYINEGFWEKLNEEDRIFLTIHEILHVIFNHPARSLELNEERGYDFMLMNVAQDICINHIIIDHFVDASKLTITDDACFIETVFAPEHHYMVKRHQSFEYYYRTYRNLYGDSQPENETIDIHNVSIAPSGGEEDEPGQGELASKAEELLDEVINDVLGEHEEANAANESFCNSNADVDNYGIDEGTQGGEASINSAESLDEIFSFVIDDAFYEKKHVVRERNWYGFDRRINPILDENTDLLLPVTSRKVKKEKKIHKICAYVDVSGSCERYSKRLVNLIHNLDPQRFAVTVYPWASNVGELRIVGEKFYWSGAGLGTRIDQVLRHYRNVTSEEKYDAFFVLTDGIYMNFRHAQQIAQLEDDAFMNWYFFLVPGGMENIPKNAHYFKFKH